MIKILATLAAFTVTAFAQSGSYKSEYDRLQKEYEAAIKLALEPIQKRQVAALEQLVRKASQAGDLATAVTAKQTLDQIAPKQAPITKNATTGASKRATLTANLISAKWAVFDTPTQKRIDTQLFNADGTCSGRLNGKWEALSGDTIKVFASAQTYDGIVNDAGTEINFERIGRTMRKE